MFHKVSRPKPIYLQVAAQIEGSIVSKALAPKAKLPGEREFAERFDVSRRTLREALRVVEQKGLIEIKKGGAFVRESSLDHFSDSLGLLIRHNRVPWKYLRDFRLEMDTILTRKASTKATAKEIEALEELIGRGRHVLGEADPDWKTLVEIDLKVHLSLARMAGNPIFEWVFSIVIDNTMKYYEITVSDPVNFAKDSFSDMIDLVEAIKQNDVEAAVRISRDHVTNLSRKYFDEELSFDVLMSAPTQDFNSIDANWARSELTRKI